MLDSCASQTTVDPSQTVRHRPAWAAGTRQRRVMGDGHGRQAVRSADGDLGAPALTPLGTGAPGQRALAGGLGLTRPEPAEARCRRAHNCKRSESRSCKDAPTCLKVKDVDTGRCICIECCACGAPCSSSADRGGGVCVFAKKCCNDTGKWCATACAQG
jgi:hypothetical protein